MRGKIQIFTMTTRKHCPKCFTELRLMNPEV